MSENRASRWFFERQLAKPSVADLLNSVVTWSKDDHRLILPNYSDMPLGCPRQRVQGRFCCRIHFWTRARRGARIPQREASNKSLCRSEGEEEGGGGGTGLLAGISPRPRGTLQSVGPAAMLKPSVGPRVKQDMCCGLTFHGLTIILS